jgi:hypothetical protein
MNPPRRRRPSQEPWEEEQPDLPWDEEAPDEIEPQNLAPEKVGPPASEDAEIYEPVDIDALNPHSLRVVIVADAPALEINDTLVSACERADIIFSLGHVDLLTLSKAIPRGKPALCVLGPNDSHTPPPPPFRMLHGSGVTFNEWRIAGFSGSPRVSSSPGFYVSEEEAAHMLSDLPPCDIFLAFAPPLGIPEGGSERGFQALRDYVDTFTPTYYFCASQRETWLEEHEYTLFTGLSGVVEPEPIPY